MARNIWDEFLRKKLNQVEFYFGVYGMIAMILIVVLVIVF